MPSMQWWTRGTGAALVALTVAFAVSGVAEAHERREVAGYSFVVGFEVEPALEGETNAVLLRVSQDDEPVEGLAETLQVEVTHVDRDTSRVFPLQASFGEPGTYLADLIPTATGQYRFRFFGTIEGTEIDEVFESGDDTFSNIESSQELQFPQALAAPADVQGVAEGAQAAAFDAEDQAASAQTMATAALAVGALGVIVGGAGVALALRRRA